ncbi:endonuclease/Exonuclease/phosphatase family protein, partial [Vibrio parahaemolyticus EKP-008]
DERQPVPNKLWRS